jgi:hypothetical protein
MPDLLGVTRRLREIGRIRLGDSTPGSKPGSKVPRKLDTFRLTTQDRYVAELIPQQYGGQAREWEGAAGREWDVHTEAAEIDVLLPPKEIALSQWFELWDAGGCIRRCDGRTEVLADGPCLCEQEGERRCNPTTRLSVILAKLPGIGVWRLESHGYSAAKEIPGTVALLEMLGVNSLFVPARLRIEQRAQLINRKRRKFPVPVIDLDVAPLDLVSGAHELPGTPEGNGAGEPPTQLQEPPGGNPGGAAAQLAGAVERSRSEQLPQLSPEDREPPPPEPPAFPEDQEDPGAGPGVAVAGTPAPAPDAQEEHAPEEGAEDHSRMLQRVAIATRDAGLDNDERHSLCAAITQGEKWSSKELTIEEQQLAIRTAQRIKAHDWAIRPGDEMVPPVIVERVPRWRIDPLTGMVDLDDARMTLRDRIEQLDEEGKRGLITAWAKTTLGKLDVLPFERLLDAHRTVLDFEPF